MNYYQIHKNKKPKRKNCKIIFYDADFTKDFLIIYDLMNRISSIETNNLYNENKKALDDIYKAEMLNRFKQTKRYIK